MVADRIRENLRKYKKMPLTELLDLSINETLSRTVLTGVTLGPAARRWREHHRPRSPMMFPPRTVKGQDSLRETNTPSAV